jgi:hypothetical protein
MEGNGSKREFKPRRARAGSNDKQIPMTKIPNIKPVYDFEERAYSLGH